MAKYFPLQVLNNLEEYGLSDIPDIFARTYKEKSGKAVEVESMRDRAFIDWCFSRNFLNPTYTGKYKDINEFLLYDKELNKFCIPGVKFSDIEQRQTEWRDMFGEAYILPLWSQSKVVYKLDSEFFHEIAATKNLKFSDDMFSHLPVDTMYFDLSEVKGIGDYYGAWVHIHKTETGEYFLTIYMIMQSNHAIFSYYCGFDFGVVKEIEIDTKEFLTDMPEGFFYQDFSIDEDSDERFSVVRHNLQKEEDHRPEIIIAICQILEFLHADIEDITENATTKSTYRPSSVIKNKFSEVRMWDVGVRYGKAIKFAKEQVNKAIEKDAAECVEMNKIGKPRKPIRPHIRSAHWQRYHVGEGRQQIKVNWIPPVYVCGGKEIAVTIHKVG